jgi:hypothetical protein
LPPLTRNWDTVRKSRRFRLRGYHPLCRRFPSSSAINAISYFLSAPVVRTADCSAAAGSGSRYRLSAFRRLVSVSAFSPRPWIAPGSESATKLDIKSFPRYFQGSTVTLRTPQRSKCFTGYLTLSPYNMIPGSSEVVKKKRELFPGQRLTFPSSLTLPYESESKFRNINLIPFHPWGQPE